MAIFDKLQSMGGNYISRLGGANIYKPEILDQMTPEQRAIYDFQQDQAKTAGMREFASRLSDAFGGRDITGRAQERQKTQPLKRCLFSKVRNTRMWLCSYKSIFYPFK